MAPIDLTPWDTADPSPMLRLDLLVLRSEDRARLQEVVDAFALDSIDIEPLTDRAVPTMLVHTGQRSLMQDARFTLEYLLTVQGLDCLSVIETEPGGLQAVTTQVEARRPAGVATARFAQASAELGHEARLHGEAADRVVWRLPRALIGELIEFCSAAAARSDFVAVRPLSEPVVPRTTIGAAPEEHVP
jgi:hypothetical protein